MTSIVAPATAPPPRAYDVRLLRLRLRLALLTMAVLPVTLAMALMYSTLDQLTVSQSIQLQERAVAVGRSLAAHLERANAALVVLAADPALVDKLTAIDRQAQAATLLRRPPAGLHRLTLLDSTGRASVTLAVAGSGALGTGTPTAAIDAVLELAPGGVHVESAAGVVPLLLISTPLDASPNTTLRAVRFEIAASDLLEAVQADLAEHADTFLVAPAGAIVDVALAATPGGADRPTAEDVGSRLAAQPFAAGQWQVADGWRLAASDLGGDFAGWRVMVLDEVSAPPLPWLMLAMLAALTALLVAITVWMSHQVIGPAQELARSREQLLGMYEAARTDSLRDALTGLGNHRAFQEELDHQLEWHRRYSVPFALLLIDLDDLKMVNDTGGHSAGDEVMRTVGRLIGEMSRFADRAFRIGGDEFAILMPHTTADGALEAGRRLLGRALKASGRPISFSGGISACPALATERDQLFAQADAALYWCKRHGRASLDVFDPVRDHSADQAAAGSQSAQITTVVSGGLLRAVYQPVVDLASGVVIGFEGLTRPLPEAGFSDPGSLFAAAEAVGRTVELDHACLETVVSQALGIAPEQLLSINLSPRTIEGPQFSAEWLVSVLTAHNTDPQRVVIELTEQQDIEDLPQLQRNLAALQRAGVRVAVDDVGAGNAGLRLLSQFRFDIVKIDLSLVQDGTRRDSSRAVLTSLRDLAGGWGAYVVAEGIETVSQLTMVRELRLSAGQGYLLGRPMPAPMLGRVDLAALEAGGMVMQLRSREHRSDLSPAPRLGAS